MGARGKRWKIKCPFNFTKIILIISFIFWDYNVIISFPPSLSSIPNSPYFPSLLWENYTLSVFSGATCPVSYDVADAVCHIPHASGWENPKFSARTWAEHMWLPAYGLSPSTHLGVQFLSPQHKPVHWGHQSSLPFTMTPPRTTNSSVFHPLDILANWK